MRIINVSALRLLVLVVASCLACLSFGADRDEVLPAWADFFESAEKYELFEERIFEFFEQRGDDVHIDDGFVLGLEINGEEQLFGLTNVGQMCAATDSQEWPTIIEEHFLSLFQNADERLDRRLRTADWKLIKDQLAIRLWDKENDVTTQSMVGNQIPGLNALLVVDWPDTASSVAREDFEKWSVDESVAFDVAISNVLQMESELKPELIEINDSVELYAFEGETIYGASIVLKLDDYPEVLAQEGALIAIPVRNMFWAIPLKDLGPIESFSSIVKLTHRFEQQGPGSVSTRIWWYRSGQRWMELPYQIEVDGSVSLVPPEEFLEAINRLGESGIDYLDDDK